MQYNLAFRATVASAGESRVLPANRELTLRHGARTLALGAFPLESECFGDRYNRDGGVRARVCARLIENRGDFVVRDSPNLATFSTVSKTSLAAL